MSASVVSWPGYMPADDELFLFWFDMCTLVPPEALFRTGPEMVGTLTAPSSGISTEHHTSTWRTKEASTVVSSMDTATP
jgi:hypothetical protein